MILSNLNRDHGLILPQLSDLQITESLFPDDINVMPLENAFYSYRSNEFNLAYDKFVDQILSKVKLNDNELKVLNAQRNRIKKICSIYFDSCNKQVDRSEIPCSELYNRFDSDGCAGLLFSNEEISKLTSACSNDIVKLQSQKDRKTSPTKHDAYDRLKVLDPNHLAFSLIDKLFTVHGIYDAVTKYNRNKLNLKLDTVALHVARPNDNHHYQTLSDVPLDTKTVSFHMDPKFNVMKAIVYLNDVTLYNGPFTTLPKSNRWYYPEFERIIGCGNSVGNYLSSPLHRKVMSVFPDKMTKNVIMGRYFSNGSEMSDILLDNQHKYTSKEANCILFDPAQTIHRGGLCDEGERVNLQIIMR